MQTIRLVAFLPALLGVALSSEASAQISFNPPSGSSVTVNSLITVTNASNRPGVAQWFDSSGNPVSDPVVVGGPGSVDIPAPPMPGKYQLRVNLINGASGQADYKVT